MFPPASSPNPTPTSSPARIRPYIAARSSGGNRSPISDATVGPAVAVTAPSATLDASSHP
nr:hypothetical protein [Actinomadura madurae]